MSTPKKKVKRRLRWGRVIPIVLIVAVLISGTVVFAKYKSAKKELEEGGSNAFIAVLGIDARESLDSVRSDVMMIAYVDFANKKLNLISLPRDSMVPIPCENGELDKITHAYFFGSMNGGDEGGRSCAIGAIRDTFQLEALDHYAVVDFDALISLVDDLGGIDVTPSKTFCEYNSDDSGKICFTAGERTTMDGEMALAYSRHRKTDNDIYRTQRQQEVLTGILGKVRKMSMAEMTLFAPKVLKAVKTNITLSEIMAYYSLSREEGFSWQHMTAPGGDYYSDGVYYYKLDEEWLNQTIADMKSKEENDKKK
ncbi:MAG: LCP family protein [Erysipelotrichales bacterium]|nr:LCP family protein [Erysipelotrichales bacterium]MBQ1386567.1 LCP family protein [Erysipelotrichales bacterium]MBQ2309672.1 LCP family protein [Erysipelotrichales bacterium]MBQ2479192.1 LCP family protein [Erysipelotrichales bacterium]MBQ4374568.1 LCP family protein [Erysipelotrichales bacterium]